MLTTILFVVLVMAIAAQTAVTSALKGKKIPQFLQHQSLTYVALVGLLGLHFWSDIQHHAVQKDLKEQITSYSKQVELLTVQTNAMFALKTSNSNLKVELEQSKQMIQELEKKNKELDQSKIFIEMRKLELTEKAINKWNGRIPSCSSSFQLPFEQLQQRE